jgi:hypothetical protein
LGPNQELFKENQRVEYIYIVMRGEFIESDHIMSDEIEAHQEDLLHKKRPRKENDIIGIHNVLEQQGSSVNTNCYTLRAPLSGCIPIKVTDIREYVDSLTREQKIETMNKLWETIAQEIVHV